MKNLETIVTTIELGGEENSKSIPVTDFVAVETALFLDDSLP